MFANLHHNLFEYGSLRDNRHSEGGPRIPTGHGIQKICFMQGTKSVGYRSKELPWIRGYHVESLSHLLPAITMPITS
ncbi:hypothetical protein TNCV_3209291 [Trichonephila clavipes]|nr:hypothetical protein TNCV_3209291 [Trichonephila clavipes]